MPFGQIIVGPPGSGKTVYCDGMQQFMSALGRKVAIINLDPANDGLPYEPAVDIAKLISLEQIMDTTELGPNGALIYAMEFLEKNIEWLKSRLDALPEHYFLFDCPGQVELYTHHNSVKNIAMKLQKWDFRLTCVHLVDSTVCLQPPNYIAAVLLSLSTMLQLELPHVNILSKIDLLWQCGQPDFNLEFYTEVMDLSYLEDSLDRSSFSKQYSKLNKLLCELIEDFSLVAFHPLNIEDKESVYNLLKVIDKSNGFVFGGLTHNNETIFAVAENISSAGNRTSVTFDMQEKYKGADLVGDVIERGTEENSDF